MQGSRARAFGEQFVGDSIALGTGGNVMGAQRVDFRIEGAEQSSGRCHHEVSGSSQKCAFQLRWLLSKTQGHKG